MNPYPLLYRLGITPWNRDAVPTRVVEVVNERSSGGRALDLGCGTGRDSVYLAERGWAVTGIDGVKQAIEAARERSQGAGVAVNWILGDVTRLETLGLGGGFDFVLDRGCFHGLSDRERERCAQGVTGLTGPGARLLLFAFQPRRLGLGPRGITAEDVQAKFGPTWDVVSVTPDTDLDRIPPWLGNAQPTWYLLARPA
ncbi:MAG: class I SAM-dependent methyltransferase [Actinobacteria bacterium]|nr:MAG: class I SAM-dependent methyltransferase [Actinomycetota bacterium]